VRPALLAAAAMAAAALPFIGDRSLAQEVSNNVAAGLDIAEPGADAYEAARHALEHRVKHFGLRCGDVAMCASCMARAWHRATTQEMAFACGGAV
jgi:hypothetical protein